MRCREETHAFTCCLSLTHFRCVFLSAADRDLESWEETVAKKDKQLQKTSTVKKVGCLQEASTAARSLGTVLLSVLSQ